MSLTYIIGANSTRFYQAPSLLDDVSGQITSPTLIADDQDHLITKEYVDQKVSGYLGWVTVNDELSQYMTDEDIAQYEAAAALLDSGSHIDDMNETHVHLTGDTVTGAIIYNGPITTGDMYATKAYVDASEQMIPADNLTKAEAASWYLSLSGGTLTGPLTLPTAAPADAMEVVSASYARDLLTPRQSLLPDAGGAMDGALALSGWPTEPMQAASKDYVDFHAAFTDPLMQEYIEAGIIVAVLSPAFGVFNEAGLLVSIPNLLGDSSFELVTDGGGQVANEAYWTPTNESTLVLTEMKSLADYRLMMVGNCERYDRLDAGTGALTLARLPSGAVTELQWRLLGHSSEGYDLGARIRYRDDAGQQWNSQSLLTRTAPPAKTHAVHSRWWVEDRYPEYRAMIGNGDLGPLQTSCPREHFMAQEIGVEKAREYAFPGKLGALVFLDNTHPDVDAAFRDVVSWLYGMYDCYTPGY